LHEGYAKSSDQVRDGTEGRELEIGKQGEEDNVLLVSGTSDQRAKLLETARSCLPNAVHKGVEQVKIHDCPFGRGTLATR